MNLMFFFIFLAAKRHRRPRPFRVRVLKSSFVDNRHLAADNCNFKNNYITQGSGGYYTRSNCQGAYDLTNNTFLKSFRNSGNGGCFSLTGNAEFTMIKCKYANCTCTNKYGGAVYLKDTIKLTMDSNIFQNCAIGSQNQDSYGGGLCIITADVFLNSTNNKFESCSSNTGGSGAYIECTKNLKLLMSDDSFQGDIINNNGNGGGLSMNTLTLEQAILTSCHFVDCTANKYGGGIYVNIKSNLYYTMDVKTTTFSGCSATDGSGICIDCIETNNLTVSILENNQNNYLNCNSTIFFSNAQKLIFEKIRINSNSGGLVHASNELELRSLYLQNINNTEIALITGNYESIIMTSALIMRCDSIIDATVRSINLDGVSISYYQNFNLTVIESCFADTLNLFSGSCFFLNGTGNVSLINSFFVTIKTIVSFDTNELNISRTSIANSNLNFGPKIELLIASSLSLASNASPMKVFFNTKSMKLLDSNILVGDSLEMMTFGSGTFEISNCNFTGNFSIPWIDINASVTFIKCYFDNNQSAPIVFKGGEIKLGTRDQMNCIKLPVADAFIIDGGDAKDIKNTNGVTIMHWDDKNNQCFNEHYPSDAFSVSSDFIPSLDFISSSEFSSSKIFALTNKFERSLAFSYTSDFTQSSYLPKPPHSPTKIDVENPTTEQIFTQSNSYVQAPKTQESAIERTKSSYNFGQNNSDDSNSNFETPKKIPILAIGIAIVAIVIILIIIIVIIIIVKHKNQEEIIQNESKEYSTGYEVDDLPGYVTGENCHIFSKEKLSAEDEIWSPEQKEVDPFDDGSEESSSSSKDEIFMEKFRHNSL